MYTLSRQGDLQVYDWRNMSLAERQRVLGARKYHGLPWHTPPHWEGEGEEQFLISAACHNHAAIIGKVPERLAECEEQILKICRPLSTTVWAWCMLPNHYHVLLQTFQLKELLVELSRFHGRSSHAWNTQDGCRGRQTWHSCVDRTMRSERHFFATLNYVHHNPVKHGYIEKWQDWPVSSATAYLLEVGREEAERIWREYPILDYGKDWDV
jgi:putative transposase